jgi:hypothetical protein
MNRKIGYWLTALSTLMLGVVAFHIANYSG